MRQCRRHTLAKRRVVVVKYQRDTRYDDHQVCSHDSQRMKALRAIRLADVWPALIAADVVGIDEGQFVSGARVYSHEKRAGGGLVVCGCCRARRSARKCRQNGDCRRTRRRLSAQSKFLCSHTIAFFTSFCYLQQFEGIAKLVPLAEKMEKLTAVCQFCGHAASFTLRTIVSEEVRI